jgi:hypothetical protein
MLCVAFKHSFKFSMCRVDLYLIEEDLWFCATRPLHARMQASTGLPQTKKQDASGDYSE